MRTPIGRINRASLVLLALLVAAVVAGLVVPGQTGVVIEAGSWIAIACLVFIEVGLRSTPVAGNYYGDERNPRGSATLERSQDPAADDPVDPAPPQIRGPRPVPK